MVQDAAPKFNKWQFACVALVPYVPNADRYPALKLGLIDEVVYAFVLGGECDAADAVGFCLLASLCGGVCVHVLHHSAMLAGLPVPRSLKKGAPRI